MASQIFSGQQNLVPNFEHHNPMVFVIVGLLSLLCMLHNCLSSSNQLQHFNNKLDVSFTLYRCSNHNINGVYQLLPKNELIWRELYRANLTIQSKLNLR